METFYRHLGLRALLLGAAGASGSGLNGLPVPLRLTLGAVVLVVGLHLCLGLFLVLWAMGARLLPARLPARTTVATTDAAALPGSESPL